MVYQQVLEKICKHLPHLQQPFPSSVFATATFNFGPNAVCNSHVDHLNWASGICAITSGGNYDFKLVGHLVLYDPKLIIEFPPGSTILIPSAYLHHGNTHIQDGEKRFALTQYSAGGLFRWLDYGNQTETNLKSQNPAGLDVIRELAEVRWQNGIGLYNTVEGLWLAWGQLRLWFLHWAWLPCSFFNTGVYMQLSTARMNHCMTACRSWMN